MRLEDFLALRELSSQNSLQQLLLMFLLATAVQIIIGHWRLYPLKSYIPLAGLHNTTARAYLACMQGRPSPC